MYKNDVKRDKEWHLFCRNSCKSDRVAIEEKSTAVHSVWWQLLPVYKNDVKR